VKKITKDQYHCLKRINWDYDIPIEDVFAVIDRKKSHARHWTQADLLVRMLERLNWYDLLDFFTPDVMAQKLTSDLLCSIRDDGKRACIFYKIGC